MNQVLSEPSPHDSSGTHASRPAHSENLVHGYIGLDVLLCMRRKLLDTYPLTHPNFVGEHVTLELGKKQSSPETAVTIAKYQNAEVTVYGLADDGHAVQCLLVSVNGEKINPTNSVPYHITWSLDRDAEVPGAYNRNGRPSKARPTHAGYVAQQQNFITLLPEVLPLKLSAKFYPDENSPVVTAPTLRNQI